MANKNKKPKEISDFAKMKKLFLVQKTEGYSHISTRRLDIFTKKDKVLLKVTTVFNFITIASFVFLCLYGFIRNPAEIDITTTGGDVYRIPNDFNKEFLSQYISDKKNNVQSNFQDKTQSNLDSDKKQKSLQEIIDHINPQNPLNLPDTYTGNQSDDNHVLPANTQTQNAQATQLNSTQINQQINPNTPNGNPVQPTPSTGGTTP